jgi:hypothetical protein
MGRPNLGLTPTIQQVRPWHMAMARAVVAGARPKDLVQMYGYTPTMITKIINSPLFRAEVSRLAAQNEHLAVNVDASLQLMVPRALEVLDFELGDEDSAELPLSERKHRVNVAKSVMEAAGHGKRDQPVHLHKHEHYEVKDLSDEELYRDVVDITKKVEEA